MEVFRTKYGTFMKKSQSLIRDSWIVSKNLFKLFFFSVLFSKVLFFLVLIISKLLFLYETFLLKFGYNVILRERSTKFIHSWDPSRLLLDPKLRQTSSRHVLLGKRLTRHQPVSSLLWVVSHDSWERLARNQYWYSWINVINVQEDTQAFTRKGRKTKAFWAYLSNF